MSDPKYVSRFPPCPLYDVEGIESWLEDLAKQGLILTPGGLFCGFASFEQGEPKPMRYRLQPWPKKRRLTDDAGPHPEAVELAKEYGWDYLCDLDKYAVFACGDPEARELDTDPQIQALSYRHLYRQRLTGLIFIFFLGCLMIGLLLWFGPLTFILDKPLWYTGISSLIWLSLPFFTCRELKQIRILKEKLSLGEALSRRKDWKRNRHRHWITAALGVALFLSFNAAVILENFVDWEDHHWQPLSEYTGERAFPTMEELAGGGTLDSSTWRVDNNNEIAVRSTLPAKTQMRFEQFGSVKQDGKTVLEGALRVDYYDLRTEWLAKALFREIHHNATLSKGTYRQYIALETPALPTDAEIAYSTYEPTLLLRNGTEVLVVEFSQFDRNTLMPLEDWTAIVAEAFVQ